MLTRSLIYGLILVAFATGQERTPLDDYVQRADNSYAWSVAAEYDEPTDRYMAYVINMTSQTWKTQAETNRPVWDHYLVLVIPYDVTYTDSGYLLVGNGEATEALPTPGPGSKIADVARYALGVGAPAGEIRQIPNQPIACSGDDVGRTRREDDLIAWTWRRFIDNTSDPDILLQLPMAKAPARAMDTMQTFVSMVRPEINLQTFMISGGSKRGWTSYLTAATDPRIFALSPTVLTCLNFTEVMMHQYMAYGGWSFSNQDYANEDLMAEMIGPGVETMAAIIDPYAYRSRLTMPKLIISASGDEHFLPDDSWYFFKDLVGPKYFMLIENSGHSIPSPQNGWVAENRMAFFHAIKTNFRLPSLQWLRGQNATYGNITVTTDNVPVNVTSFYAQTVPGVARRDFRMHTLDLDSGNVIPSGIVWLEKTTTNMGNGIYFVEHPIPASGFTAFFIKLTFAGPTNRNFVFTSEVNIIPDVLPYPRCTTAEECRGTLL